MAHDEPTRRPPAHRATQESTGPTAGWWRFVPACAIASIFGALLPSIIDPRSAFRWWPAIVLCLTIAGAALAALRFRWVRE